jgi:soluble lytic murein transglycosylase
LEKEVRATGMMLCWLCLCPFLFEEAHAARTAPATAPSKKRVPRPERTRLATPPLKAPPSDPAAVRRLGQANQALREGKFDEAYALALPLAHATLRNRDYALHLAGQAAFLSGRRDLALPLFQRLSRMSGSRFATAAAWKVADCQWDLGHTSPALYERLLSRAPASDEVDRAPALLRVGDAHDRARRSRQAVAAWKRLALGHPTHPLADVAVARLRRVLHAEPLSPRDRLARAEVMNKARAWPQALDELSRIVDPQPDEVRVLRDYWIGETLFDMRRQYGRAGELLISVHDKMGSRAATALFHGARALSRADRDDEAIAHYGDVVRKYPRSDVAPEAQFLSGWLEYNRARYRQALPGLRALLLRYPFSKFADDAMWYLGYSHYLLGEYPAALGYLSVLAEKDGPLVGGKGRYWKARTLSVLGNRPAAHHELARLVSTYPFSWYALLARARLREDGAQMGPFGSKDRAVKTAPPLGPVEPALAADPLIARADELSAAGMQVEAGYELRRGEAAFLSRYGAARALAIVLDRYRKADNYHRPWQLAESYGRGAFALPPFGAARPWWENFYPLAYRALVEKYESLAKNPPYYLYAIMWKESGFNPHDVSYADAIGLMQMIPPTTQRVAPKLGLRYTDDLLYDPELNVRVGSWYVGSLAEKFKQQIPIAAGSFNSGPKPVMKWLDRHGERPIDEFVELVAYTQTREYMKKVTGAYARYIYLYGGKDYEQPLAVDRDYLRNDLDY